jgi:molecular chaperone GrpE
MPARRPEKASATVSAERRADERLVSGKASEKASATVSSEREEQEQPVVRDKRRIDPRTGAVRPDAPPAPARGSAPAVTQPAAGASVVQPAPDERLLELEAQVAERTADLQRLQAEYVNYRRRVERDREAVRELAVIGTLTELLPVLDDIGRARDHGELTGGFKVVAEALEATLAKLGLQRFGDEGDVFDPKVHEALLHEFSPDVAEPTCVAILQPGYRVGERIVRPARVKVAEPEPYDPSGGDTVGGDTVGGDTVGEAAG